MSPCIARMSFFDIHIPIPVPEAPLRGPRPREISFKDSSGGRRRQLYAGDMQNSLMT